MKRNPTGPKRLRKSAPRSTSARQKSSPSAPAAKLFIVSADVAAQHGIARFFAEECAAVKVCGGCGDVAHSLAACLAAQPAAVLVDVEMDGGAGWRLLGELARQLPNVARVARLGGAAWRALVEAGRAGVRTFCTIADAPAQLAHAVQCALAGEAYVSPGAAAILRAADLSTLLTATRADILRLSEREAEVFHLLGAGLSTEEIATRLALARKTINNHCANIRKKLGIPSFRKLCQHAAVVVGGRPAGE